MELTILRQGARDQEARVSLKAVDVSALYGKDYILTVKEGAFLSQTLRKEDESGTLMDQYEAIGEEEAAELEEQKEQEEAVALKEVRFIMPDTPAQHCRHGSPPSSSLPTLEINSSTCFKCSRLTRFSSC